MTPKTMVCDLGLGTTLRSLPPPSGIEEQWWAAMDGDDAAVAIALADPANEAHAQVLRELGHEVRTVRRDEASRLLFNWLARHPDGLAVAVRPKELRS